MTSEVKNRVKKVIQRIKRIEMRLKSRDKRFRLQINSVLFHAELGSAPHKLVYCDTALNQVQGDSTVCQSEIWNFKSEILNKNRSETGTGNFLHFKIKQLLQVPQSEHFYKKVKKQISSLRLSNCWLIGTLTNLLIDCVIARNEAISFGTQITPIKNADCQSEI